MELNCKSKILDDLYEIRGEGLIRKYIKQNGKPKSSKKAEKTEKELVEFMKKFITDKNDMEKLFEKINNFESDVLDEMCFWHKPYYKLGFIDGMSLKKEIKEEKCASNNSNEDSIYNKFDDIWDYVDKTKHNNLKSNEYYNNIKKELIEINSKYPRVEKFIYDEKIEEFTPEEMKAILKVISLYKDRFTIEEEEMFKIGVKTGKSL